MLLGSQILIDEYDYNDANSKLDEIIDLAIKYEFHNFQMEANKKVLYIKDLSSNEQKIKIEISEIEHSINEERINYQKINTKEYQHLALNN